MNAVTRPVSIVLAATACCLVSITNASTPSQGDVPCNLSCGAVVTYPDPSPPYSESDWGPLANCIVSIGLDVVKYDGDCQPNHSQCHPCGFSVTVDYTWSCTPTLTLTGAECSNNIPPQTGGQCIPPPRCVIWTSNLSVNCGGTCGINYSLTDGTRTIGASAQLDCNQC